MIHLSEPAHASAPLGALPVVYVLVLLAVGVGLVALFFRGAVKMRWALAGILGLPMLIFGVIWLSFRPSAPVLTADLLHARLVVPEPSLPRRTGHWVGTDDNRLPPIVPATRTGGGNAWWPETDEVHRAVCYPSPRDAARALARNVAGLLQDPMTQQENLTAVHVLGRPMEHADYDWIVEEVANTLREHLHVDQVIVAGSEAEADGAGLLITIDMKIDDRRPARWCLQRNGTSAKNVEKYVQLTGRLQADIRRPDDPRSMSVQFVDKPWVKDFATFASTRSGRYWVLGRSEYLLTDRDAAKQQAIAAAVRRIAAQFDAIMMAPSAKMDRFALAQSDPTIIESLGTAINSGHYIVDQFSQELMTRNGGSVWRHAILVDFTPLDVERTARLAVNHVRQIRARRNNTAFSFFGLLALTCVVYVFLNSVTKGYFRGSLLCATVAVVVTGGAALWSLT